MTIHVDIHEPWEQALVLFSGAGVDSDMDAYNELGMADYHWQGQERLINVERKQWGEVLGGLDAVEDQLRRHLTGQPDARLILIIEGLAVPNHTGTVILKQNASRRDLWHSGFTSTVRLAQVYSWLYQIQRFVEVYQTPTYDATCIALASMYKGELKEDHDTFKRYYNKVEWNPDPRVQQAIGLWPGIGMKRAAALIERFVTIKGIIDATPKQLQEVNGIGKVLSKQLLQQVGRTDV